MHIFANSLCLPLSISLTLFSPLSLSLSLYLYILSFSFNPSPLHFSPSFSLSLPAHSLILSVYHPCPSYPSFLHIKISLYICTDLCDFSYLSNFSIYHSYSLPLSSSLSNCIHHFLHLSLCLCVSQSVSFSISFPRPLSLLLSISTSLYLFPSLSLFLYLSFFLFIRGTWTLLAGQYLLPLPSCPLYQSPHPWFSIPFYISSYLVTSLSSHISLHLYHSPPLEPPF